MKILLLVLASCISCVGQLSMPGMLGGYYRAGDSSLLNGLVYVFDGHEIDSRRNDVNGSAITGADNSSPVGGVVRTQANYGYSMWVNGSNILKVTPTNMLSVGGHDFTVMFDFYWTHPGSDMGILSKSSQGAGTEWAMEVLSTGLMWSRTFSNAVSLLTLQSTDKAVSNAWNRVIYWRSNNVMSVKLNTGTPKTGTESSGSTTNNSMVNIGVYGNNYFTGGVGNVCQWNRALTSAEITTLASGATYPFRTVTEYLRIVNPTDWQVTQRNTSTSGVLHVEGIYQSPNPGTISASYAGSAFVTLDAAPANGRFSGSLTVPAGQGQLVVKSSNGAFDSKYQVGIGDVFLICGQSNASGRGTFVQTYSLTNYLPSLLQNSLIWSQLYDPTDDAITDQVDYGADGLAVGSVWPDLAQLYTQPCPIAFIPCALSATLITNWQPTANHFDRGTLYGVAAWRATNWPAKCFIWWQGEGDAAAGTSTATYFSSLTNLTYNWFTDTGLRTMVAKLHNTTQDCGLANFNLISNAFVQAWASDTNTIVGPDLWPCKSDVGGVHLGATTNLQAAAALFWAAMTNAFGW